MPSCRSAVPPGSASNSAHGGATGALFLIQPSAISSFTGSLYAFDTLMDESATNGLFIIKIHDDGLAPGGRTVRIGMRAITYLTNRRKSSLRDVIMDGPGTTCIGLRLAKKGGERAGPPRKSSRAGSAGHKGKAAGGASGLSLTFSNSVLTYPVSGPGAPTGRPWPASAPAPPHRR